jgi:ParB family chromosome partitioning protein
VTLIDIPLSDLRLSPKNVRQTYWGIKELAESIREYGLLQNLVVREAGDHFEVVAGNRRFKALELLASESKWTGNVHCVVISGDGTFENLIENTTRHDVPIWQLGYRFQEILDAGYTQKQIAARVGKSQGYVSIAVQIASGLCPAVVRRIERVSNLPINQEQLLVLSKIINTDFRPDEEAQLEELKRLLGQKRRKGRGRPRSPVTEKERVWQRYRRLKQGIKMPGHAAPYFAAFMSYLDGSTSKLTFR